jgi:hypothetical protein
MPTSLAEQMAVDRPFIVALLGAIALPLPTAIGRLDWLMGHPLGEAIESGFRNGRRGELLWLPPGDLPAAGVVVVGLGDDAPTAQAALDVLWEHLPPELPGSPSTVVVLPPHPLAEPLTAPWPELAATLLADAGTRRPSVGRWMGLDWEDTLV